MPVTFPKPFEHDHPPVVNIHVEKAKSLTLGEQAADTVADMVGSWRFIIVQSVLLTIWIFLNVTAWIMTWDPYPFILLNLFLSMQAAYTAPMLMMSQNRQAQLDRLQAEHDYQINLKAEAEIRHVLLHLEAQNEALIQMQNDLTNLVKDHIARTES